MQRDLVLRSMEGDRAAFTELGRLWIDRLYAAARLILIDQHRAEDATQEALLAAWRDLKGLRDPDRFEPWLRRILVNACYREARKDQSWRRAQTRMEPITGDVPDPADRAADRDVVDRAMSRPGARAAGARGPPLLPEIAGRGDRPDARDPGRHRQVTPEPSDDTDASQPRCGSPTGDRGGRGLMTHPQDFREQLPELLDDALPSAHPVTSSTASQRAWTTHRSGQLGPRASAGSRCRFGVRFGQARRVALMVGALLLLALTLAAAFVAGSRLLANPTTIIVAADGSGDVTTLGGGVAMAGDGDGSSSGQARTSRS